MSLPHRRFHSGNLPHWEVRTRQEATGRPGPLSDRAGLTQHLQHSARGPDYQDYQDYQYYENIIRLLLEEVKEVEEVEEEEEVVNTASSVPNYNVSSWRDF